MTNLEIGKAIKKVKGIIEIINNQTLRLEHTKKEKSFNVKVWKELNKAILNLTNAEVIIYNKTK